MGRFIDLTGKEYVGGVVVRYLGKYKFGGSLWLCRCTCGKERPLRSREVKRGRNCVACGKKKTGGKNRTHGDKSNRIYRIWSAMKNRCHNPNNPSYKNYGGRGIKVCTSWKKNYVIFRDWALANGYHASLSIDRIDVNGNYEPSNCRWATAREQANNMRCNRIILFAGVAKTLQEWSRTTGLKREAIAKRLRLGWSTEKALKTPVRTTKLDESGILV